MKIGVFGDVHGCIDEMRFIIDSFADKGVEKIVSLGDLTDRGPDSAGCVEFWQESKSRFSESVMIRGNHDDKVLRVAKHTRNFIETGKSIPMNMSKVDSWQIKMVNDNMPISWLVNDERGERILNILSDSVLFHKHGNFAFVHGGIPPRMYKIPYHIHKCKDFMYCRYVSSEDGKMISLGDEKDIPHHFWAEKYDGRFGTVFFGHQPHAPGEVFKYKYSVALDTGCVFGGALSGVILNDSTGEMDLIQKVPKEQYAENLRP